VTGDEDTNVGSATAMCAAGDIAIGGGVNTQTDGWSVRATNPNSTDKNPTGWFGEITGNGEAEHHGGDGKDNSSGNSLVGNNNDDENQNENQDENQNEDENENAGPATGTVYAVCVTP
jgi:hypothetical protein